MHFHAVISFPHREIQTFVKTCCVIHNFYSDFKISEAKITLKTTELHEKNFYVDLRYSFSRFENPTVLSLQFTVYFKKVS